MTASAGSAGIVGGRVKRILDLAIGLPALILLSPLFLLAAVCVCLSSPGPALFRARRVGVGGRVFDIYKFRSMRAATAVGPKITEAGDSRITPLGRLMRVTKLDELPQLLNVVRGQMSVVGPRPEEEEVLNSDYPEGIRGEILRARPGLTGLLQVRVFPDMTNEIVPEGMDPQEFYRLDQLPRRVAVDLDYVRHWSAGRDIGIIFRTIGLILFRAPWILVFGRRPVLLALPPVEDPGVLSQFAAIRRAAAGAGGGGAEGERL
jgi:lipopolysaccharide/colanic/teichoic acid biosynthesis glycosyltransferase